MAQALSGYRRNMDADHALAVLGALDRAGIRAWVSGGWAVDAMAGRQTREHGDLDLALEAPRLDDALALLAAEGYAVTVDWLPARIEVGAADGRRVDIHPIRFARDGSARQAGLDGAEFHYAADGFTVGRIGGVTVPCLSIAQQRRFREGYPPRPEDVHDIGVLDALADGREPGS